MGLVASVYQLGGGPPWPTAPEIHPRDTVNASSEILPFEVTNKSAFFPLNAKLVCGVDLLYFKDATGKTGLIRDAQFVQDAGISVEARGTKRLPCNPGDFVKIKPDGSVLMGFPEGQFLQTKPRAFQPPMTIIKICVLISGTWDFLGIPRGYASTMFQWPALPDQRQWAAGPITHEYDDDKWVPEGSTVGGAWGLRRLVDGASPFGYAKGALTCDWPK